MGKKLFGDIANRVPARIGKKAIGRGIYRRDSGFPRFPCTRRTCPGCVQHDFGGRGHPHLCGAGLGGGLRAGEHGVCRIAALVLTAGSPASAQSTALDVASPDGSLTVTIGTGDALTYAWDLDGDGAYDDSTAARPTRTYGAGTVAGCETIAGGDRSAGGPRA